MKVSDDTNNFLSLIFKINLCLQFVTGPDPLPKFIEHRLKLWQEEKARQDKIKQEDSIKYSPEHIDIVVKNVPGQSSDPIRATKNQTTPWQLVGSTQTIPITPPFMLTLV